MTSGHSNKPLDSLVQFGYSVLGGFLGILTITVPLSVVLPWTTMTTPTGETSKTLQTSMKTTNVTTPEVNLTNVMKKSSTLCQ